MVACWVRPLHVGARPEAIGYAAPAHGDAAFAGALRVAIGVRGIAEQFVTVPADFLPQALGQRLGDDRGAVERQPSSFIAGDAGGKPFGGADDRFGAHGAAIGRDLAFLDRRTVRLLVDRHTEPFDGCRKPAHQLGRLHPCLTVGTTNAQAHS